MRPTAADGAKDNLWGSYTRVSEPDGRGHGNGLRGSTNANSAANADRRDDAGQDRREGQWYDPWGGSTEHGATGAWGRAAEEEDPHDDDWGPLWDDPRTARPREGEAQWKQAPLVQGREPEAQKCPEPWAQWRGLEAESQWREDHGGSRDGGNSIGSSRTAAAAAAAAAATAASGAAAAAASAAAEAAPAAAPHASSSRWGVFGKSKVRSDPIQGAESVEASGHERRSGNRARAPERLPIQAGLEVWPPPPPLEPLTPRTRMRARPPPPPPWDEEEETAASRKLEAPRPSALSSGATSSALAASSSAQLIERASTAEEEDTAAGHKPRPSALSACTPSALAAYYPSSGSVAPSPPLGKSLVSTKTRVPVLLSEQEPFALPLSQAPGTVCVMGLHKSGTHILAKYMRFFFDVSVQPAEDKRNREGVVALEKMSLWKHTIPSADVGLPSRTPEGSVCVLLCVREVLAWMDSLSQNPYEIFSRLGTRRKRGSILWMFDEVEVRTGPWTANPFPEQRFSSVMELWKVCIRGYLEGNISPGGDISRVFLVRHEDIAERPGKLVLELERLGFPRNQRPFAPFEEGASDSKQSRAAILERAAKGPDVAVSSMARVSMSVVGCREYLEAFNYPLPGTVGNKIVYC